ncbi:hypothetical protein A2U01_0004843, partial [Trifolium medium]|nr:hypothetical protein [Trifolium medium]
SLEFKKGKNSDFLGGGVGDRKLIKDRLRSMQRIIYQITCFLW